MRPKDLLRQAADAVACAESVVILVGDGLSASAGVASPWEADGTYSPEGAWAMVAMAAGALGAWSLAPGFTWEQFVHFVLAPSQKASPTRAHEAMADLAYLLSDHAIPVTLLSGSADGLQARAGPEGEVVEVRGSMHRFRCTACARPVDVPDPVKLTVDWNSVPRCPECDLGYARPDCSVGLEPLPEGPWQRAIEVVDAMGPTSALVVAGTHAAIPTALARVADRAASRGAYVVDLQMPLSPASEVAHVQLRGPLDRMLPAFVTAVHHARELQHARDSRASVSGDAQQLQQRQSAPAPSGTVVGTEIRVSATSSSRSSTSQAHAHALVPPSTVEEADAAVDRALADASAHASRALSLEDVTSIGLGPLAGGDARAPGSPPDSPHYPIATTTTTDGAGRNGGGVATFGAEDDGYGFFADRKQARRGSRQAPGGNATVDLTGGAHDPAYLPSGQRQARARVEGARDELMPSDSAAALGGGDADALVV